MTEFLTAVPIVPARDIAATTAWYRDELGFEVFLVTFFEPPAGYDPREEAG